MTVEDKWGKPQSWGLLKVKYKPTGEVKELKLGIRRMSYHNELIFCEAWGYDKGEPTDLNNPDNYEVLVVNALFPADVVEKVKEEGNLIIEKAVPNEKIDKRKVMEAIDELPDTITMVATGTEQNQWVCSIISLKAKLKQRLRL